MSSQYPSEVFSALRRGIGPDGREVPAADLLVATGDAGYALRALWLRFPVHSALLRPIADSGDRLVLHYAAITGSYAPIGDIARFAVQLTDAYRRLFRELGGSEMGRLCDPFYRLDATNRLRIGFQPAGWSDHLGAETKKTWPACDERSIVHLVGSLVADNLPIADWDLRRVLDRCRHSKPGKRFQTLDELYDAFTHLGQPVRRLSRDDVHAWHAVEEIIGWLELGDPERALAEFEKLDPDNPFERFAYSARNLARGAIQPHEAVTEGREPPKLSVRWTDAEHAIREREKKVDRYGALQILSSVTMTTETEYTVFSKRAQLHLALGHPDKAVEHARRALATEGAPTDARILLVEALVAAGEWRDALAELDTLVALVPGIAAHHYTRGKLLRTLGRPDDARAAFDRALAIQPTFLEAMVLRRDVDRGMASVRREVGSQGPIHIDVPESLRELRTVLTSGATGEAIAALSDPRFDDHPDALLVRGRLLAFDRQLDAAIACFDRLATKPEPHRTLALLGKAPVLLELERADEALAILDRVCAELPSHPDASEARATALAHLGRDDEAAAEYRRFLGMAVSRSDLRVRTAEIWLDQNRR